MDQDPIKTLLDQFESRSIHDRAQRRTSPERRARDRKLYEEAVKRLSALMDVALEPVGVGMTDKAERRLVFLEDRNEPVTVEG